MKAKHLLSGVVPRLHSPRQPGRKPQTQPPRCRQSIMRTPVQTARWRLIIPAASQMCREIILPIS